VGWVVTDHDVRRTSDDGRTWHTVTPAGLAVHAPPAAQQGPSTVYGLGALDARHAYLATETGNNVDFALTIWRTDDGGATWTGTTLPHLPHETGAICSPRCFGGFGVTFDVLDAGHAFMSYAVPDGTDLEDSVVFTTSDGGAHWLRLGSWTTMFAFFLAFSTPTTGLVSNGRALYSTTSGWGHWTVRPIATVAGGTFEAGPVASIGSRQWLVGGGVADGLLYAVSADHGRAWSVRTRRPSALGADVMAPVAFLDPSTWLAGRESCSSGDVCSDSIWVTTDAGHSWHEVGALPALMSALDGVVFTDRLHGWAGTSESAALYATEDGGRTWRRLLG
jgi:photosystem II stability/assembly factor-like uncharacterized protein